MLGVGVGWGVVWNEEISERRVLADEGCRIIVCVEIRFDLRDQV